MKKNILFLLCYLCFLGLFAQKSGIENTRLSLTPTLDTMVVHYDLTGKLPAFYVKLQVTDSLGKKIPANTLAGDFGHRILPGVDKTIYWNMKADKAQVYGSRLKVMVMANVSIPKKVEKGIWIPWLYIASAASAGVGIYSQVKSDLLYKQYPHLNVTAQAETHNREIRRFDSIRNISYVSAGVLGLAGVVVHIRHLGGLNSFSLNCQPSSDGAIVGLTCNF